MSTERTPSMGDSLLSAPLAWLTRLVLLAPKAVLVTALVLAVAAVGLAIFRLGFRTSRLDLLSPESAYNSLWLEYIEEFGDGDDAVIVVESDSREQTIAVIDELGQRLLTEPALFNSVLYEIDLARIRSKGLHYLSAEELNQIERDVAHVDPIVHGGWAQLRVDRQLEVELMPNVSPDKRTAHLERISSGLLAALKGPAGTYVSPWRLSDQVHGNHLTEQERPRYMLAKDGRMGLVLFRLGKTDNSFAPQADAIDRLRWLAGQVEQNHSGVQVGLTGLPVMENDEMRTSESDMITASVVSLVGVACLFMAGLGGVRHPLLTVGALLLAMAWSLGYITLSVGHLNILSVSFGVILIGLGIDFGIHYVARYLQIRQESDECREALVETAGSVGPGVVTGAVTTALAFFAAYFTNFVGVAELGVIAGGGILLCLLAALFVLPAMIFLADHQQPRAAAAPLRIDRWIAPLVRVHGATLPIAVLATALLALGVSHVAYDHNLLHLQAEGLESVELERKLLTDTGRSAWYAISVADSREALLQRKEEFLRLSSVERTEEIVSLLPAEDAAKLPIIERIHQRLADLPKAPPLIPVGEPRDLVRALQAASRSVDMDTVAGRAARESLLRASDAISAMPVSEVLSRLSNYQQRSAEDLLTQLRQLQAASDPAPPAYSDLPLALVSRFVGKNDRHLLRVYGRGDIWDMDALSTFVADVKRVDARATGQPLQAFYASRQMQRCYVIAALYALAAVTLVLLLDLRSIAMAMLALVPVVLGMLQMFGLMGWLGIPLNPANMIVLPLILGIGLDDGVHVVHDYRRTGGRDYQVSPSTAMAVVITSLTTMIGFGSLMLASHRGLESLGRVLTLGVACCMFSSLIILPALLRWMKAEDPGSAEHSADGSTLTNSDPPAAEIRPTRRAA